MFTICQNNWTLLKRILALPTWGQKCIVSELYPKDISNFDLGHPVVKPIGNPGYIANTLNMYNTNIFRRKARLQNGWTWMDGIVNWIWCNFVGTNSMQLFDVLVVISSFFFCWKVYPKLYYTTLYNCKKCTTAVFTWITLKKGSSQK